MSEESQTMTGEADNTNEATRSTQRRIRVAPFQPVPAPPSDDDSADPLALPWLLALSLVVGCITGIGAVVFRDLVGFVHNLLLLSQISFSYDASHFTPVSPWGVFVIFVPVVGARFAIWIAENFAPEAKGRGVPEVVERSTTRAASFVLWLRSLNRQHLRSQSDRELQLDEGPIIQIGSALGSTLGQLVGMTAGQRITLVAAGAGAGIAATFNTPIDGGLLAIEVMTPEISVDTFLPVVLATGTATFIGRRFFGGDAAFPVPAQLGAIPNQ
ncbi:protein of unknown function (plasmid) [Pararobbsia alpina]